jgi:hypothetical protein
MSSNKPTVQSTLTINRLVLEVRQFGSAPDILREKAAAHLAGMRLLKGALTEGELRAVIYDAVFGHAVKELKPCFMPIPRSGAERVQ